MKPSDVFFEMGCGDASLLIYVTKKAGLHTAMGFENMPSRVHRARQNVAKAGLKERITIEGNMYDADLSQADVIFDMMPEGSTDYQYLYSRRSGISKGTKLIKHDLPLVGFLPDKIDLPFYSMKFPLRKAKSQNEWARSVLLEPQATIDEVWRELAYYNTERFWGKSTVRAFGRMLSRRVPKKD